VSGHGEMITVPSSCGSSRHTADWRVLRPDAAIMPEVLMMTITGWQMSGWSTSVTLSQVAGLLPSSKVTQSNGLSQTRSHIADMWMLPCMTCGPRDAR